MISKTSQTYKEIRENSDLLLKGPVLIIDPSIGSTSSMPGYAVYTKGELLASGILKLDPTGPIGTRLNALYTSLKMLEYVYSPAVLGYEKIPITAHGGRSQLSQTSLLMALGVTQMAFHSIPQVGIMPISWKKMVRDTYRKGDEEDAIEMGWILIRTAMDIEEQDPPRKYGQKQKKGNRK